MKKQQPLKGVKNVVGGFFEFIREQGVVSLAVGFILGGSITKLVTALVNDIITPTIGIFIGSVKTLNDAKWIVGNAEILWGNFAATTIDFIVVAFVVYVGVKIFGIDKIDKKKEK